MRPTAVQIQRIRVAQIQCQKLREEIEEDGENDLGAALSDACNGLNDAMGIIEGKLNGSTIGKPPRQI